MCREQMQEKMHLWPLRVLSSLWYPLWCLQRLALPRLVLSTKLTCGAEQRAQQALILCDELGQLLNQAAQRLAGSQGVPRAHIRLALRLAGLRGRLPDHVQDQLAQVLGLLQVGHQAPIDGLGLLRQGFGQLSAETCASCMPDEIVLRLEAPRQPPCCMPRLSTDSTSVPR